MTCADVRNELLETDLEALEAGAPGPLREHLATCPRCRAAADRVLRGTAVLAAARDRAPRQPADRVVQAARLLGGRRQARTRRLRLLVPLLAAASLAVFFLGDLHVGPEPLQPPTAAPASLPPLVEGGSHDVAVLSTTRPDVTVVWQF